ncbi:MAG: prepilin-type N-terminal cleavage/methylation domain-containing protein [bacterium]|nr:prepilin-type N-terminal cleavage/methylation domain-containing protein [bacterium]
MNRRIKTGFTLIELLIVVAIIGILAAIAVPNFLNAQIKAKIARVHADVRGLSTAIEMYSLDHNSYPWFNGYGYPAQYNAISYRLIPLTTPVSYCDLSVCDPFLELQGAEGYEDEMLRESYNYRNYQCFSEAYHWNVYALNSLGPDRIANKGLQVEPWARGMVAPETVTIYQSSNGLISAGDMPHTGGDTRYRNPD